MYWKLFLYLSFALLAGSITGALVVKGRLYKKNTIFKPFNILFMGVVLSSIALFVPIYASIFKNSDCGAFETVLIAIHSMLRLFAIDGDIGTVIENVAQLPLWLARAYSVMFSILVLLAPILTFGFILSFFENVCAYIKYSTRFNCDAYIFSQLNEKSIALAESVSKKSWKKSAIVFADVCVREDADSGLTERAKALGSICFEKDIVSISFAFHNKKSEMNFFVIGQDQAQNITQAIRLIKNGKYGKKVNLYVFSTQNEAEILLYNAFEENEKSDIKIRRINEAQSLILRNLFDNGYEKIFNKAIDSGKGYKEINAVVLGMGLYGREMTKALSWYCQMDGYRITINSFDLADNAESKFCAECPELTDDRHNGIFDDDGEANYLIKIHSNTDIATKAFEDKLMDLPKATYILVALGDDGVNINTAIKLRALFERKGLEPTIQAIVYDSDKKAALDGIKNFKGQEYNIDFIGDIKSSYSKDVVLDLDVEAAALKRHLKWGKEEEFWKFNYNYKSSIASAIHHDLKLKCSVKGIDKPPAKRSREELWAIRRLEHRRWNAYMRSEGYVYGGTIEKSGRNDLAKTHNCLVHFDELPLSEKQKDDD